MTEGGGGHVRLDMCDLKRLLGPVSAKLPTVELDWLLQEAYAIELRSRMLASIQTEEWDFDAASRPDRER